MPKPGSRIYDALSDPTRRAILKRLRAGSKTAGELGVGFDLTKPTLSHHFRVLREAGLVRSEQRGTRVVYTLQSNVIEDLVTELLELADASAASRQRKGVAR